MSQIRCRTLALAAGAFALAAAGAAGAALKDGASAPLFTAPGYQGGQPLQFDLARALKKGPVVLYFFPAAETKGCNLEAHLFATAIDRYHAEGATVIGVTAGNLDKLAQFSKETEHCSGKFPVAADPNAVIAKQYDATLSMMPGWSSRTSYVIAPDDKVIFSYSDLNPSEHVDKTLAALTAWREAHRR